MCLVCSSMSWPSTVIVDDSGKCLFWFYDIEPEKLNPCGNDYEFVPENATPIDKDFKQENET